MQLLVFLVYTIAYRTIKCLGLTPHYIAQSAAENNLDAIRRVGSSYLLWSTLPHLVIQLVALYFLLLVRDVFLPSGVNAPW